MDATDSNKRRKTAPPVPGPLGIADLPIEALAASAEYLPKPSRALFAAAMTQWHGPAWEQSPSATSRAIASLHASTKNRGGGGGSMKKDQGGSPWSVLDFADVEHGLARRLTDDDIAAVLVCIDAPKVLRVLKLTGCINITGGGLTPLRHSTFLEQVDLSLVGKSESPCIWPEPSISEADVLPIIGSVICTDGSSLRQLQLPKKFRSNPGPLLDEFIESYDEFLETKGGTCPKCCEAGFGSLDHRGCAWVVEDHASPLYGLQDFTCYECTEHLCSETCLGRCMACEKQFCGGCVNLLECKDCGEKLCEDCGDLQRCADCGEDVCADCCPPRDCCSKVRCERCIPHYRCEFQCGKAHCSDCFRYVTGNNIEKCVSCGTRACACCRYLEHVRNPEGTCGGCMDIINKVQRLHERHGVPFV